MPVPLDDPDVELNRLFTRLVGEPEKRKKRAGIELERKKL